MKTFKDVMVWQASYDLTLLVYRLTANLPKCEEFGLKSQLRRAAVSVISNFAEGFKRFTPKDRVRFYKISEGSLEEIKCQTMLAKDLSYFTLDEYESLRIQEEKVGRLLYGWIKSQTTLNP